MSANPGGQGAAAVVTIENAAGAGGADRQGLKGADGQKGLQQQQSNGPITITRRFLCSIKGSPLDFSQDGQGCATWRAVEGKQASIWGLNEISSLCGSAFSADSQASATHLLGNVVLKSLVRLEHASTHKREIGVTIHGVPSREVTGFGEAYCYTVLPESTNMVPMKLYEASEASEEGMRWRKEYPKYNRNTLDKHGVLETGDLTYLFVHQTHPAIALLRANKDLLGSDIDAQQKIDNEWYKVQKETFTACCNTLQTKVLQVIDDNVIDLRNLSVEISPIGQKDWLDIQDGEDVLSSFTPPPGATANEIADLEAKHLEAFCEKRCSYHARFEITFEIHP